MKWRQQLVARHLSGRFSRPAVRWMNVFAFFGLMLSVFAWVTVLSVMSGMQGQIQERVLSQKPHLLWEGRPRPHAAEYLDQLRELHPESVERIEVYLRSEALLELHMQGQERVRQTGAIVEGRDELQGDELQMGVGLAAQIDAHPGDFLRLRSVWALERFPLSFQVRGFFETRSSDADRSTLRISRDKLSEWLEIPDSFSFVGVFLKNPTDAASLVGDFSALHEELQFQTWQDVDSALWFSLRLEKILMNIALIFIVVLSSFALYMSTAVRLAEKTKELALLRALGALRKELRSIFLFEGALLGFVAAFVGLLLSYGVCQLLSFSGFYSSLQVPTDWSWTRAFLAMSVVLLFSVLAALWPLKKAFDFSIAETLRS